MIKSMTAFGRGSVETGETSQNSEKSISVEIKSVNSRYLDCSFRLPRIYSFAEEKIKAYLQSRGVCRGKVDVFVNVSGGDSGTEIDLDAAYLEKYLPLLARLRDEYGLRDDISVMNVAKNSAVFTTKQPQQDADRLWEELLPALTDALDVFTEAREREGRSICLDLEGKIEHLRALTDHVAAYEQKSNEAYRTRLETKLRAVLAENGIESVDEARIVTECAIFADKVAVDEETVRLRSHFDAFIAALHSDGAVGRRLEFLLQEMGREVNTIGSKASDLSMTNTVVDMKSELERIREQVQNIE